MPFTLKSQRVRFDEEKRKLKHFFGNQVTFHELSDRAQIEVKVTTTKNNFYMLRCYLEADFPNSMPALVVSYPDKPLKDGDGIPLGATFANHCLGFETYGLTQICHCRADRWDPKNMNLREVFLKGLLWLKEYETLVETGENIATRLQEMPMSDEMQEKIAKLDKMMLQINCQSPEELFAAFWLLFPTLI